MKNYIRLNFLKCKIVVFHDSTTKITTKNGKHTKGGSLFSTFLTENVYVKGVIYGGRLIFNHSYPKSGKAILR